jgi:predicted nucleic acid-binding protein
MLVIDTSALVEVLTTDPAETPVLARRVHDVEWMSAPSLIDYEVLNVLRKLVLRGAIDVEFAEDCRRTLRALRLLRYPMTDELADRVWQLRHNASAYDASYVALAEHLNVPLVTAERRLAEGVRGLTTIPIESYVTEDSQGDTPTRHVGA